MSVDLGPRDLAEYIGVLPFVPPRALGTVVSVTPSPFFCTSYGCTSETMVTIREWPVPDGYEGWCSCSWRPVSRRGDFEALLETLRASAHDLVRVPTTVPA